MRPLKILLWHVHGAYLYYLSQVPHEFYVLSRPDRTGDYAGRSGPFPWPDNLHEVPVDEVKRLQFDCVLFQRPGQYTRDQFEILTEQQRRLPKIYLEHDPPSGHPTDSDHPVDDPDVLLVHVTPFNALMWNSGRTPTVVIEHGIMIPADVHYSGEVDRGIAVVNNLATRGRRHGADIFDRVRKEVPLDLVGTGSEVLGGFGDYPYTRLPAFAARYRFFFSPVRYASLGLAVCEAMMIGMPILGLATAEMATAVINGVTGYVDTDAGKLIPRMKELLQNPREARRLGEGARRYALERFNIRRFLRNWTAAFALVTGAPSTRSAAA